MIYVNFCTIFAAKNADNAKRSNYGLMTNFVTSDFISVTC